MESFSFEIPYVVPNANAQLRMHHRARERIKNRIMEEIMVARSRARATGRSFPDMLHQFHLCIERHAVSAQDFDNAVASHKPLIDAMKHDGGMGLICNDDPKHMLTVTVTHVPSKRKNQRTIIKLVEGQP